MKPVRKDNLKILAFLLCKSFFLKIVVEQNESGQYYCLVLTLRISRKKTRLMRTAELLI